jgi:gas vesicle protein
MSLQRLLVATLTGVVIGILIAPAKGSETRQKISDSADNFKSKFRRIKNASREELDELRYEIEDHANGLRDDVRQKLLNLIRTARAGYNNIKSEALSNQ